MRDLQQRLQDALGDSYAIESELGGGGMAHVFRAHDRTLDRDVVIKVLTPEVAASLSMERFAREIHVAARLQQANIVPVISAGTVDELHYYIMPFVEGESLRARLAQSAAIPLAEATRILADVARALHYAHEHGIIHRDIKPENVLLSGGAAVVTDFGIAKAISSAREESEHTATLTAVGTSLGTAAYMSPEQAAGDPVDARTDLYAWGVIGYEILAGQHPFADRVTLQQLMAAHATATARPLDSVRHDLPAALVNLVRRTLNKNPNDRPQSAAEILADLERISGTRARRLPRARYIAGAAAAVLLLAAAVTYPRWWPRPSPTPMTILLSDFENDTGDPMLSGTLEPLVALSLEGVPFITSFDRVEARRIARRLYGDTARLDRRTAALIGQREGIHVIVAGRAEREDRRVRLTLAAMDAVTGDTMESASATVAATRDILGALGALTSRLRAGLGDVAPPAVRLAASETFTSTSLAAAYEYSIAQELGRAARPESAIVHYQRAIALDSTFGRAYAGLAVAYFQAGDASASDSAYSLAFRHMSKMTDRERYRTRAVYYLTKRDYQAGTDELSRLVAAYPYDGAGWTNLAVARFYARDFPGALQNGRAAVQANPRNMLARGNLALFAMYAGDLASAREVATDLLKDDTLSATGMLVVAVSAVAQSQFAEADSVYRRMIPVGGRAAAWGAAGLADLHLLQGNRASAESVLVQGIASDRASRRHSFAALKSVVLAEVRLTEHPAEALALLDRTMAESRQLGVLVPAAELYVRAGRSARALGIAAMLDSADVQESRAYAQVVRAQVHLAQGNLDSALVRLGAARDLADTWLGRRVTAEALLAAGRTAEARAELETCLQRKGEATSLFLDDVPTYRVMASVRTLLEKVAAAS